MFLVLVVAILCLDAYLAFFAWAIIEIVWNNIVKEELEVRSKLPWVCLLGTVVATANAVVIAVMSPMQGVSTSSLFVSTLLLDVFLMLVTWLFIIIVWNKVVKEKFKVMSGRAWTSLLGIVVLIANTAAIAYLLQR